MESFEFSTPIKIGRLRITVAGATTEKREIAFMKRYAEIMRLMASGSNSLEEDAALVYELREVRSMLRSATFAIVAGEKKPCGCSGS